MTRQDLLALIKKTLKESHSLEDKSNQPKAGMYNHATTVLKKMKLYVEIHETADTNAKNISNAVGMFAVKEMENFDSDFSEKLADVSFNFDRYYDLIDPQLLKIMQEEGDI